MAEVGGFRERRRAGPLGVSAEDKEGRKPQGQFVRAANSIGSQIEFVELARDREALDPDAQSDFGCIFFSHKKLASGRLIQVSYICWACC